MLSKYKFFFILLFLGATSAFFQIKPAYSQVVPFQKPILCPCFNTAVIVGTCMNTEFSIVPDEIGYIESIVCTRQPSPIVTTISTYTVGTPNGSPICERTFEDGTVHTLQQYTFPGTKDPMYEQCQYNLFQAYMAQTTGATFNGAVGVR